jgi:hypothetical protein
MPSKPKPARAAVRSTTDSRRRPAAESNCPSGRPGPGRFDAVSFESLPQDPAKLKGMDPTRARR